jgi:hypothetical protein
MTLAEASAIAGIAGIAAGVISPIVVLFLQRRHSRKDRVRARSEDAAQRVLGTLAEIRKLYEERYHWKGGGALTPGTIQGDRGLMKALQMMRQQMHLLDRRELRSELGFIASALGYSTAIRAFQGDSEVSAGVTLCEFGNDLVGAYLRDEGLPQEPELVGQYRRAIEEADRVAEEAQDDSSGVMPSDT